MVVWWLRQHGGGEAGWARSRTAMLCCHPKQSRVEEEEKGDGDRAFDVRAPAGGSVGNGGGVSLQPASDADPGRMLEDSGRRDRA